MRNRTVKSVTPRRWEGYTLEELRCQRALAQARIMIEQSKLEEEGEAIRDIFAGHSKPKASGIAGRILGALSYMDWIMLGIGVYKRLSPIFKK